MRARVLSFRRPRRSELSQCCLRWHRPEILQQMRLTSEGLEILVNHYSEREEDERERLETLWAELKQGENEDVMDYLSMRARIQNRSSFR